jgi:SnoaL-like protein
MQEVLARPYRSNRPLPRRRAPWERLSVAAPWLYRWAARSVLRSLRVDSRLRRALLGASFRSGYGAFNRRDFDLMLVRYTKDCEFVTSSGLRSLGASGSIRNHDGLRQFVEAIAEAWQGWELRPHGFIDLGDRVLWLGTQRAQGGTSRIPIEDPYAQLQDIDRGLISRQQAFNDWDAALRAAGLHRDQVLGLEALGTPHSNSISASARSTERESASSQSA